MSIAFLALGFYARPVFALDPNDEYPSLLWGVTTVVESPGTPQELTVYSQTEGNEIMRNVATATLTSPTFDFAKATNLFILGGNFPGSLKLLNSRTSVNGSIKATTAVLREVGVNVFGDSNNALGSYNYWGKHLRATSDNSDSNAFWQQKSYQFNPSAQAYWNSGNNATMIETIARLLQNAKPLSNGSTNSLTGIFNGICYPVAANTCTEANQYSDGRVWYSNGSVSVSGGVTYSNKATIIVKNGDLAISGNLSADQNSSIGFIVQNGSVNITNSTGSKKINASFFVPKGSINIPDSNIDLTGSFVANDFNVHGSNINFIQDTRGESAWPPGFRDLQPLTSISK